MLCSDMILAEYKHLNYYRLVLPAHSAKNLVKKKKKVNSWKNRFYYFYNLANAIGAMLGE